MHILIIGGTGFIGPFVARQLHAQGHELLLFHRGKTAAALPSAIGHLHGDRDRLGDLRDELRRFGPEVAIDMQPMTERHAETAVTALRGIARRLVAISSIDVYRAFDRLNGKVGGPLIRSPSPRIRPSASVAIPIAATPPWRTSRGSTTTTSS